MVDDATALMERARERLAAAQDLLALKRWDDAVNRAYFSMFAAARALLSSRGVGARTHRGVVQEFGRVFVQSGLVPVEFGRTLREARELREEADYGILTHASEEEAGALVRRAGAFVERADELLKS